MKKLVLILALAAALPAAWANPEWVRAKIVKLDAMRGKVTLDHEPIRSIQMDAMTMPFKVKDPARLTSLRVGDTVWFTVSLSDGELAIEQIEVRP